MQQAAFRTSYTAFVAPSLMARGWLREGDQLVMMFRHGETKQPVPGVTVRIAGQRGGTALVSDGQGRVFFPVRADLVNEDSPVEFVKPSGVLSVDFSLTASFSGRCDRDAPEPGSAAVGAKELAGWPRRSLGSDVLYVEPGTDSSTIEKMVALLARERQILRELVGHDPPAMRVAIVRTTRKVAQDANGRSVWTIPSDQVDDDRTAIETLVHEWAHDFCRQMAFIGDETTRFLEDGLCDLLSHLVLRAIRPDRESGLVAGRLRDLETRASSLEARVNLLTIGQSLPDRGTGESLEARLSALCNNPLTLVGYALGLAYWLDHLEANPGLVRDFFGRLTPATGKNGPAMVALLESLAPARSSATGLDVKRALETLQRHQRPR